jgi:hypothetical protein
MKSFKQAKNYIFMLDIKSPFQRPFTMNTGSVTCNSTRTSISQILANLNVPFASILPTCNYLY